MHFGWLGLHQVSKPYLAKPHLHILRLFPPHLPFPCPPQVIGSIDGSGRVTLVDNQAPEGSPSPVDLNLDQVLGKMPNKTFHFTTGAPQLQPLSLPEGTSPQAALERVLRLPSVCSKRFLTTKVDRHVTGAEETWGMWW
jgi:phosphoribosylformylglycinamidine (FGAM) synthase-like enzyme